MPEVVFMQLGSAGFEQLAISRSSYQQHEPKLPVRIYTDVPSEAQLMLSSANGGIIEWAHSGSGDHAVFGSEYFGRLTLEKIRVMRDALERTSDWILFSDVDVLLLQPFAHEFEEAFQSHAVLVSCEGYHVEKALSPRNFCAGLLGLKKCIAAIDLLDEWEATLVALQETRPASNDQEAFNQLVASDPARFQFVYPIPFGYPMSGWAFPLLAPIRKIPFRPTFFHCNWCLGNAQKVKRLKLLSRLSEKNSWPTFLKAIPWLFLDHLRQRPPYNT
jgi:hypothetical protein